MEKKKLYLGVGRAGQKRIATIETVRIDLISRDEAIELFSQLIEDVYDEYENEGNKYEPDNDNEERD